MIVNMAKPGRKPHQPTDELREFVKQHATMGTTQETIAQMMKIDFKTLCKYYRDELDFSRAEANASVGGALYNKAMNGDTAAMIFWMKTQARWSEKSEVEQTITHNAGASLAELLTGGSLE